MRTVSIDETDAETLYDVSLARPVRIGRAWIRPGQAVRMKGKIIQENADNVAEIREIAT